MVARSSVTTGLAVSRSTRRISEPVTTTALRVLGLVAAGLVSVLSRREVSLLASVCAWDQAGGGEKPMPKAGRTANDR